MWYRFSLFMAMYLKSWSETFFSWVLCSWETIVSVNILFVSFISLFNEACFGVDITAYFKWLSRINCSNKGIWKKYLQHVCNILFFYMQIFILFLFICPTVWEVTFCTHIKCCSVVYPFYFIRSSLMYMCIWCLIQLQYSFFKVLGSRAT